MLVNYRGDVHYMPDWLKNNLKNLEFIKTARIISGASDGTKSISRTTV